MSFYEIHGGRPLEGTLTVQGAKNSVLPILAATLLAPGESVIHNCPDLSDVSVTLEILRLLGCRVRREGDTVTVDASALGRSDVPDRLMRQMRSSVIFLGALLARLGDALLCCPGGCELGPRPIDLHLGALRGLGAEIQEEEGQLRCCRGGMCGREIYLSSPSVGATENIMLAACGCPGTTTLVGAAREPEIEDLQIFLQAMGAKIQGAGSSTISIEGGVPLHGAEHTVIGDRIAAATYLCSAACAGGRIALRGTQMEHLGAVVSVLRTGGCRVEGAGEELVLSSHGLLRGVRTLRTAPHPGFPTDAQALLMGALAGGRGTTMFVENMFDSRYRHVDELRRMGADIQVAGRVAVVTGVNGLHSALVEGGDLRAAAGLVVAALGAEGTSQVYGLGHVRRGYQHLDRDLRALGAQIQIRDETVH